MVIPAENVPKEDRHCSQNGVRNILGLVDGNHVALWGTLSYSETVYWGGVGWELKNNYCANEVRGLIFRLHYQICFSTKTDHRNKVTLMNVLRFVRKIMTGSKENRRLSNNHTHQQRNRRWDQKHENLVPKSKVHLYRDRKNLSQRYWKFFEWIWDADRTGWSKKSIERCQLVNWEFVQILD